MGNLKEGTYKYKESLKHLMLLCCEKKWYCNNNYKNIIIHKTNTTAYWVHIKKHPDKKTSFLEDPQSVEHIDKKKCKLRMKLQLKQAGLVSV